ncbi:MAG TPA: methyl-accepting chemotaxis protein, partial [Methylotenera sp.]
MKLLKTTNTRTDAWAVSTDKLMSWTLLLLFIVSLIVGFSSGTPSEVFAIGLPALLIPLLIANISPGAVIGRFAFATAFMVFSALFIQQTQGMNEAHFSVFILLALLLSYRDWKPIFVAASLVSLHHVIFNLLQTPDSGFYLFQQGANNNLVILHTLTIVFEAVFLMFIANNLRKEALMVGGTPEEVVSIARQLANGNLAVAIDVDANDTSSVKFALKSMSSNILAIVDRVEHITLEHTKGNVNSVVNVENLHGSYRAMAEKINVMLAAQSSLVHKIAQNVIDFSNGNFDKPFDALPGNLKFINEAIEQLRANVKTIIEDVAHMSKEHEIGNIDVCMDASQYKGAFAEMVGDVDKMVGAHVREKEEVTQVMRALGDGDFEVQIQQYPGKKAEINKNLDRL